MRVFLQRVAGRGLVFEEVDYGADEELDEVELKKGDVEFLRKVAVSTAPHVN